MNTFKLLIAAGVSSLALASAAQASDAFSPDASMMSGVVDSGNFDGAFIGVFGGGALSAVGLDAAGIPDGIFDLRPEGGLLGVDAGFNYSLGNGLVLGVVGDIAWTDQSDDFFGFGGGAPGAGGLTSSIDWLGSVRARAGFDAGNFMPYLTAGLAFAHNTVDVTTGADPLDPDSVATTYSDDQTHVGWTIGAGVEFAATENLSIDLGYRYSDYGSASYAAPIGGDPDAGTEADFDITSHQLTVGLNFGF